MPDPSVSTSVLRSRWVWPFACCAAWLVFSLVMLPYLVQGIYERRFLGFLHQAISPERHELAYYLEPCRRYALLGFAFVLTAWGLARLLAQPGFYRRFVAGGRPESLGAIRMLTAGVLLVSALWEELPTSVDLPRGMVKARGLIALLYALPGFDAFVTSEAALAVFQISVVVALLLAALGWKTRWTVPAAAVGYLILGAMIRQYSWFYHTGLVPCLVLLALSFTPCGDRFSLDHVLRSLRGLPPVRLRSPEVYAWGRYLCWCTLALPYVAAGLSKLRVGGLDWFSAESFRYWLYRDALNPMEFDFDGSLWLAGAGAPDVLFTLLALAGAGGEVGYGLVLFSRYARVLFPAAMFTMHIGILLLQNVLFFDLILMQLIFVNWSGLLEALGRRLRDRRGSLYVLFDGRSALSARVMRLLGHADWLQRLEPLDFRRTDLAAFNAQHGLDLGLDLLEQSTLVVNRGRVRSGVASWRVLAAALPPGWLLLPFLYVPGAEAVGRIAARRLASHRPNAASREPARPARDAGTAGAGVPADPARSLRRVTWAVACLMIFCWVFWIDYYPLTRMSMYSTARLGWDVTFSRLYSVDASGRRREARLGDAIGVMKASRYRKMLRQAQKPEYQDLVQAFFEACARRANHRLPPAERITEYQVEFWRWNYRRYPEGPQHAERLELRVFPVRGAAAAESPLLRSAYESRIPPRVVVTGGSRTSKAP
jgi:predicted DCC family thiol-disulfide oxidoreductase YuxK